MTFKIALVLILRKTNVKDCGTLKDYLRPLLKIVFNSDYLDCFVSLSKITKILV